jgi:AcrR family transcriptional regulator
MGRDSTETKRSIFEAATAEFATHGIAGARIDRIAASAGANKQLIYTYFGNKRELFEAVVDAHVRRFMDAVPFRATDLPAWAGEVFDFFVAHPEIPKLGAWHSLEPGESEHRISVIEAAIADRTLGIQQAQGAGVVDPTVGPAEIFALIYAMTRTWVVAPPEREPDGTADARTLRRRRAAVVEATRRLVEPG